MRIGQKMGMDVGFPGRIKNFGPLVECGAPLNDEVRLPFFYISLILLERLHTSKTTTCYYVSNTFPILFTSFWRKSERVREG